MLINRNDYRLLLKFKSIIHKIMLTFTNKLSLAEDSREFYRENKKKSPN